MKFNLITSAIAFGLACLIAYGFHAFGGIVEDSTAHQAITLCAFLFTCLTLLCAIGIEFGTGRTTAVIRAVAGTSFLIGLVVLVVLAVFTSSIPLLVTVMGIMTLLFMLVAYAVSRSGQ
jgi:hypothetical protein